MSNNRKKLFTHPQVQASFAFSFIRGALISVLLPACALFLTVYLMAQDPSITGEQKTLLLQEVNQLIIAFLWIVLIITAAFGALGVYASYKFVGPIRRIEDWIVQNISDIKTHTIKLRPGDELSSITHVLNRLFYH